MYFLWQNHEGSYLASLNIWVYESHLLYVFEYLESHSRRLNIVLLHLTREFVGSCSPLFMAPFIWCFLWQCRLQMNIIYDRPTYWWQSSDRPLLHQPLKSFYLWFSNNYSLSLKINVSFGVCTCSVINLLMRCQYWPCSPGARVRQQMGSGFFYFFEAIYFT